LPGSDGGELKVADCIATATSTSALVTIIATIAPTSITGEVELPMTGSVSTYATLLTTITRLLPQRRMTAALGSIAASPARLPTVMTRPMAAIDRPALSRMSGSRAT
jgi:hypothetical protein